MVKKKTKAKKKKREKEICKEKEEISFGYTEVMCNKFRAPSISIYSITSYNTVPINVFNNGY